MHKERLSRLASFLREEVPKGKFNLLGWRHADEKDLWNLERPDYQPFYSDESLLDPKCGTAGCAVGWACALPEFKKEGLRWMHMAPVYEAPYDRWYNGWNAVNAFFGLVPDDSYYLFQSYMYEDVDDPIVVADRIDAFVKSDGVREEA